MHSQLQFLQEAQQDPYCKEQLSSNALSIVSLLGGIENVLTLCLTHPDTDKDYCDQVLSSIKQIIPQLDDKIASDNLLDTQPSIQLAIVPSVTITPIAGPTHVHAPTPAQKTMKTMMVQTPREYHNSAIIVNPDINHNLYFKWLSYEKASKMMSIIFTKWYSIGCVTLVGIMMLLSSLMELEDSSNHLIYLIYLIAVVTSEILPIIFSITWILSMNLNMINIIRNSFDFWFKMWNLVIWEFSYICINIKIEHDTVIDLIIQVLSSVITFCAIFTIDAVPVKYSIKRKTLFIIAIILSFFIIVRYFTYDDYLYMNPFESYNFKYTKMSVKSLHLGAYTNIVLFVAKPMLGDGARWLSARCCLCCTNKDKKKSTNRERVFGTNVKNVDKGNNDVERSVLLYKRSKVKWRKG